MLVGKIAHSHNLGFVKPRIALDYFVDFIDENILFKFPGRIKIEVPKPPDYPEFRIAIRGKILHENIGGFRIADQNDFMDANAVAEKFFLNQADKTAGKAYIDYRQRPAGENDEPGIEKLAAEKNYDSDKHESGRASEGDATDFLGEIPVALDPVKSGNSKNRDPGKRKNGRGFEI